MFKISPYLSVVNKKYCLCKNASEHQTCAPTLVVNRFNSSELIKTVCISVEHMENGIDQHTHVKRILKAEKVAPDRTNDTAN